MMDAATQTPVENAPDPSAIPAEELARMTDDIVAALKTVYDPEIPVDIYELGLIYGVAVDPSGSVEVTMTLTSPNCPSAVELPGQVEAKVRSVPGVMDARVEVVFDESDGYGLNQAMSDFWNAWQDLSLNPSGTTERSMVAATSQGLADAIREKYAELEQIQEDIDTALESGVETVNRLVAQIEQQRAPFVAQIDIQHRIAEGVVGQTRLEQLTHGIPPGLCGLCTSPTWCRIDRAQPGAVGCLPSFQLGAEVQPCGRRTTTMRGGAGRCGVRSARSRGERALP